MANNTTKKAGSNKSFIDRMGGQKFIVLLVVIALFIFCLLYTSPSPRDTR